MSYELEQAVLQLVKAATTLLHEVTKSVTKKHRSVPR